MSLKWRFNLSNLPPGYSNFPYPDDHQNCIFHFFSSVIFTWACIFQQLDFFWTCLLLIPTDDLLFASSNIDTVSLPCWSWSPVILELSFLILLSRIIFIFIIRCATLIILIQIQMDVSGFSNTSTSIMKAINCISTLVSGSLSPMFTVISLSYWNWDFHKNCGPLNQRSRSLLLDSVKSFDA